MGVVGNKVAIVSGPAEESADSSDVSRGRYVTNDLDFVGIGMYSLTGNDVSMEFYLFLA